MRAGDRAEKRYNRRREQDGMCAPKTPQDASGIVRRFRRQPCVSDRLDDKDDQHEQRPDQCHGAQPPECWVGELGPEVQAPSHPEPCRAREGDRPPHLHREALFDRFEQRPALSGVVARARQGQRDKRDERNAADPVRDEEDMQRSGEFDVVQLAHARARLESDGSGASLSVPTR